MGVVKLRTTEGTPVHVDVPSGLLPLVVLLLSTVVGLVGWMTVNIVQNQRILIAHEERLEYIEGTRFTSDMFRREMASFVTQREFDAVVARLDRIEEKVDRLLERRDGEE